MSTPDTVSTPTWGPEWLVLCDRQGQPIGIHKADLRPCPAPGHGRYGGRVFWVSDSYTDGVRCLECLPPTARQGVLGYIDLRTRRFTRRRPEPDR